MQPASSLASTAVLRCDGTGLKPARAVCCSAPQPAQKWVKLAAPAAANANSITLSTALHGWRIGDRIVVGTTSFSWKESEIRTITSVSGATITLDTPLQYNHASTFKAYASGRTIDMRAEVGHLSSANAITITPVDGASSYMEGSEKFGARVVVSGNATGRFEGVVIEYCGQAGLENRACLFFDRLAAVTNVNGTVPNPSSVVASSILRGMVSTLATFHAQHCCRTGSGSTAQHSRAHGQRVAWVGGA